MVKKREQKKAPARITAAQAYVNTIAPEHQKISCSERALADGGPRIETVEFNARYSADDLGGCYRCTLMSLLNLAVKGELADEDDDDELG